MFFPSCIVANDKKTYLLIPMNFFFTKYIFPLEKEKTLSRKLGFVIDNPRGVELQKVSKCIEISLQNHKDSLSSPIHPIMEPEFCIKNIADLFLNSNRKLSDLKSLYDGGDYFEFLARMQVIIRCNENTFELNEIERNKLNKNRKEWESKNLNYPYNSPISKQRKTKEALESYGYLIASLLSHYKYGVSGGTTILAKQPLGENRPIEDYFSDLSLIGYYRNPAIKQSYLFGGYDYGLYEKDKVPLFEKAKLIDSVIDKPEDSKILYVASILRTCHESFSDVKVQFVLLVSILELLLTHKPDFNRYNVEDSINKQFQLKTSICLRKYSNDTNLEEVKKNLKLIYSIRSSISHGDYNTLKKLYKINSDSENIDGFVLDYVMLLYEYVIKIIQVYLNDKEYVDFLKSA